MSGPFGSSQWMYASGDYEIENSVRFNDDNAQTFSFTPSTNGTSTDVFTVSFWCKRGKLGESQYLFDIAETTIAFNENDHLLLTGDPAIIGVACSIVSDITNGKYKLLKWDKQERKYYPIAINLYEKGEIDGD